MRVSWTGIADEPLDRGFVRMHEGRVRGDRPDVCLSERPGGDERVVDLAGQTLLPGLIDCHVHFVYSGFAAWRKSTAVRSRRRRSMAS
jgi:imidazolonepropionase-like amidohydrolase